ncbi:MAG TPA: peptidylprolyl isomerase [Betaproteobacteria bacterium]|nr:peptidylprolyl isomerase [Betaproteobacteria bacterium]
MSDEKVGKHKAVYLTYSILDDQGTVFEQSDLPVGYIHGGGSELFEKIETALEGKTVGERVEVTLTPEEGFGERRPELTYTDDLDNVPPEFHRIGAEVEFQNDEGETLLFTVSHIEDGKLTIDANHSLAGKTVTFVVNVSAVRDASREEIANGAPFDSMPPQMH